MRSSKSIRPSSLDIIRKDRSWKLLELCPSGLGEIEVVDKYLNSYDSMHKLSNYYLDLTGDKNIVYNPLCPKEKYSDIL
jgi:hypothetical protein